MTASHTAPDTRHGSLIDSLADADELLAQRARIVKELAPLRALYGGTGYFGERVFKLEEAKVDTAVRAAFKAAETKTTEPMIDAAVRQRPDYINALMAEIDKKARWVMLEESLASIDWRLRVRASDSSLLAAEARL